MATMASMQLHLLHSTQIKRTLDITLGYHKSRSMFSYYTLVIKVRPTSDTTFISPEEVISQTCNEPVWRG